MSEAKKKFSPLRQFNWRVVGNVVLTLVASTLLIGTFHEAHAQANITDIKPRVVQPDGILIISFSGNVNLDTVTIGNVVAPSVVPISAHELQVRVPSIVPMGLQEVVVTQKEVNQPAVREAERTDRTAQQPAGPVKPLKDSVMIAPQILGLRANKSAEIQSSRVVLDGAEVILQFSEKIPAELRQRLQVTLINAEDPCSIPQGGPSPQRAGTPCPTPIPTVTPTAAPTPTGRSTTSPTQPQNPTQEAAKGSDWIREEYACLQKDKSGRPVKAVSFSIPEDNYLLLKIPDLDTSTYIVQVCVDGTRLGRETRLRVEYSRSMYISASVRVILLMALLYIFYLIKRHAEKKKQVGQKQEPYYFLKMLLIEPENQTYSLSRAQFLGWTLVIVWCFLFLYYAHGLIEEKWSYPNLGNAIYAFLISLGTLVLSQATNRGMGVKGAGEEHPSLADLVVHGGVLALDRVQQVIWTVIALGMFIRITVTTYATATALPDIPNELLALMGLSSAGYLGGKLVRGPGPVIEQVTPTAQENVAVLTVTGKHFSKEPFVWIDGEQLPKGSVTAKADDPDDPVKFAKELEVTLKISLADWNAKDHAITVVNSDAQRADWRTLATILEVVPGQPSAGKVTLTIKGVYIAKGASIQVKDAGAAKQDNNDPNLFTVSVPETWVKSPHDLILKSGGKESTFRYKPATGEGGATDTSGTGATDTTGTGATGTEPPEITEVTAGQPDDDGNVTLTIECTGVSPGATIKITADPSFQPVQDNANPNLFTVQVASDWTKEAHQLLLESNGQVSSFTYPPSN